jgi:hypothetical protein
MGAGRSPLVIQSMHAGDACWLGNGRQAKQRSAAAQGCPLIVSLSWPAPRCATITHWAWLSCLVIFHVATGDISFVNIFIPTTWCLNYATACAFLYDTSMLASMIYL